MITSKLTTKAQTTVPQAVRNALNLTAGDELVYEVVGDRVTLTKAKGSIFDDPFATFTEWDGEVDRVGYADF